MDLAKPAPLQLTPLPEGQPRTPEAAALVESARLLLRERQVARALEPLERAGHLEPDHPGIHRLLTQTRIEAKKVEVEALATAALNHFLQNDYKKARKVVKEALALDPKNRKAQELMKILGTLG